MSTLAMDQILDDCIEAVRSGTSTVQDCLDRHPAQSAELKPLLNKLTWLETGRTVQPSAAMLRRSRIQLYAYTSAHPRRSRRAAMPVLRLAATLAALILAIMTPLTIRAQSALPGDALYNWKRMSEQVWRLLSADRVAVDLQLADRRMAEILDIGVQPAHEAVALQGYEETILRLRYETQPQDAELVIETLTQQQETLTSSGISVPQLDSFLEDQENLPESTDLKAPPDPDVLP